ncbi:MAG TPA: hypothetical protein VFV28_05965 [Limnobacter sp.]|nr:hypothetical protein [Limnobacter sp.]
MNTQPNTHTMFRPPSDQVMTDARQPGGATHSSFRAGEASQNLGRELLGVSPRAIIEFHCKAMEGHYAGVPVGARIGLSSYLVGNRVLNPGGLTDSERRLCRWTLLEHAFRHKGGPAVVSAIQLKSFMKPGDEIEVGRLAKEMDLKQEHFWF